MPSKDTRLQELEVKLERLKSRKRELEAAADPDIRRRFLRPLEQNIASTEREIRKREYVLSPKRT